MTALLEETELQTMSPARFAEALAAGLVAMVARLSAESDPFSDLSYDLELVASEADRLRAELLDLLDEDFRSARARDAQAARRQAAPSRESALAAARAGCPGIS